MRLFELEQKLTEKALARSDLIAKPNASEKEVEKRLNRFALFTNKFIKRLPFKTTGDEEVKLKITRDARSAITNGEIPAMFDVAARRKVGTEEWIPPATHQEAVIKFTQLEKTADLGGEASGRRLDKETKALESLQQQITELKGNKPYILIDIGGNVVKVAGVVNVDGTPKSDFNLVDVNNQPVAFISHKDGSPATPKKFGQWAGVSAFANHPEVKNFVRRFLRQYPNGMPSGATALSYPIKDPDLQMKAVYGKDFGGEFGLNNVNCIIQGPPKLEKIGNNKYKLSSLLVLNNGDPLPEGYQPIFIARYFGSRNDLGIPNTRIVMYPKFGRKSIDIDTATKQQKTTSAVNNKTMPAMTPKEKAKLALATGGKSKKG
jgi:hypothetical protein